MIRQLISLSSIFTLFVSIAAQSARPNEKGWLEIPADQGVVSIVHQPDAPVSIASVQLLTNQLAEFPTLRYRVQNRTKRQIASISVEFHQISNSPQWGGHADSWIETTGPTVSRAALIGPGGTYENLKQPKLLQGKLYPVFFLDAERKTKLLTLWVGFIRQVVFKDGSKYNSPEIGDSVNYLFVVSRR